MPKRMTDTDKWKDPWFDSLSPVGKAFFYYLIDHVDAAGIWKTNFGHFERNFGFKYSANLLESEFSDKIIKLPNGNYLLVNFIKFQYTNLKPTSNVAKGIRKCLEYNNLEINPWLRVDEGLANPGPTHKDKAKAKDEDKDKDKDKDNILSPFSGDFGRDTKKYWDLIQYNFSYPKEIFDEVCKDAFIKFQMLEDPEKLWSRFLANYFKNEKQQIRNRLLELSQAKQQEEFSLEAWKNDLFENGDSDV